MLSDGFFEFRGIPRGEYEAILIGEGAVWPRTPVSVRYRGERIDLSQVPKLRLASLLLELDPAVDLYGEPWSASLVPLGSMSSGLSGEITLTSSGGLVARENLEEGGYLLIVSDSRGSRWHSESVQVSGDVFAQVELPVVPVQGTVTKGDEPQSTEFVFGSTQRPVSVRFKSDSLGRFSGYLPHEGVWEVERLLPRNGCSACGQESPVALDPVMVEMDPSGVAHVELILPDTVLRGLAVEGGPGRDRPVPGARITVIRTEGEKRREALLRADEDGTFEVSGLEPGRLEIQARAATNADASEWVSLLISESDYSPEVTLRLRRHREFTVSVASPRGAVAGAMVVAVPSRGSPGFAGFIATEFTNGEGEAVIRLPHRATGLQVLVAAAGYAARVLEMRPEEGTSRNVEIEEGGGVLHLRSVDPLSSPWEEDLWLHQNGAPFNLSVLLRSMRDRVSRTPERTAVLGLAAGEYTLCKSERTTANCSTGVLMPYSELQLDIPSNNR